MVAIPGEKGVFSHSEPTQAVENRDFNKYDRRLAIYQLARRELQRIADIPVEFGLDIGPDRGQHFKDLDYIKKIVAVEADSRKAEELRLLPDVQQGRVVVLPMLVQNLELRPKSLQVVTDIGVIGEGLKGKEGDADRMILKIWNALEPGGLAAITVLDFASIRARLNPLGEVDPELRETTVDLLKSVGCYERRQGLLVDRTLFGRVLNNLFSEVKVFGQGYWDYNASLGIWMPPVDALSIEGNKRFALKPDFCIPRKDEESLRAPTFLAYICIK